MAEKGRATHDTTAENPGGRYRATDVDIETTVDVGGGYDLRVGGCERVAQYYRVGRDDGDTLELRVASQGTGGIRSRGN